MRKLVASSTLFPAVSTKAVISKENIKNKPLSQTTIKSPALQHGKGNAMLSVSQSNNDPSFLRSPVKNNESILNKSSQNQSNE